MQENDANTYVQTNVNRSEKIELKNVKLLYVLMSALLIADWVMPQYFGFHIGFDFTSTRIFNLVLLLYFALNPKVGNHFMRSILDVQATPYLGLYMLVIIYTTILRINVNTFFLNFLDILTFYMVYYGIRYVLGVRKAIKWTVNVAWFLSIYGIIEYVLGYSPMIKFLMTLPNAAKVIYRSGQYRIMGPCVHSIAYGMMILLLLAVVCIDYEREEMYLFQRPLLYVLLLVNIFLTGSRGPLGLFFLESALILLFSKGKRKKKSALMIIAFILCFSAFEAAIFSTSLGRYIMMQITSVIDEALGTSYAVNFGADALLLSQSSNYRDLLPRIFGVDWLNPWLGRGLSAVVGFEFDGVYVKSIDNFFVALYIRYGYPGMITYIIFFIMTTFHMLKTGFTKHSGISKVLAIGFIMYCVSLWWADYLQTTKYMYIIVAIYAAYYSEKFQRKEKKRYE